MRLRSNITDIREIGHDVLSSTQSPTTGALLVTIGDATSGTPYDEGCPVWNANCGLMCRPANPTKGQNSCQTLEFSGSDHNTVVAMRDLRSAQSIGTLAPGDSCLYESAAGKARIYARASGEIDIVANNGTTTITINTDGTIQIGSGASNFVALANLVQSAFEHFALWVKTGVAPSGGGFVTYADPAPTDNVAATITKAK